MQVKQIQPLILQPGIEVCSKKNIWWKCWFSVPEMPTCLKFTEQSWWLLIMTKEDILLLKKLAFGGSSCYQSMKFQAGLWINIRKVKVLFGKKLLLCWLGKPGFGSSVAKWSKWNKALYLLTTFKGQWKMTIFPNDPKTNNQYQVCISDTFLSGNSMKVWRYARMPISNTHS